MNHKREIYVYAHWFGMKDPKLIGVLSAHQGKGRKSFGILEPIAQKTCINCGDGLYSILLI